MPRLHGWNFKWILWATTEKSPQSRSRLTCPRKCRGRGNLKPAAAVEFKMENELSFARKLLPLLLLSANHNECSSNSLYSISQYPRLMIWSASYRFWHTQKMGHPASSGIISKAPSQMDKEGNKTLWILKSCSAFIHACVCLFVHIWCRMDAAAKNVGFMLIPAKNEIALCVSCQKQMLFHFPLNNSFLCFVPPPLSSDSVIKSPA